MAFPPRFLDELRARISLSELIGPRLKLVRVGREYKACCPFHQEKTPSFYVNDDKGFYHCFGCGAHGDIIGFLMAYDGLNFLEAVRELAGKAGLEMPELSPQLEQRARHQKTLHEALEAAACFYEQQLFEDCGQTARDYLDGRGLNAVTMRRYRLGYAPPGRDGLIRALGRQGIGESLLAETELISPASPDRSARDFFRNRVLFPISDRRGRVVAFGGRLISGDGPKYINSRDYSLFHKGQILYGHSRAQECARRGEIPVVVEGYMDVIALAEAGFGAAVAPLGTALTEAQLTALWRMDPDHSRCPILCFDGDNAGRRAAWRSIERLLPLLSPGNSVRIAWLPQGEDPDSLIRRQGASSMRRMLDQASDLTEAIWTMMLARHQTRTPEGRAALEADLNRLTETINDPIVQRHYRAEWRQRIGDAFFRRNFQGKNSRYYDRQANDGKQDASSLNALTKLTSPVAQGVRHHEETLVATLLANPRLIDDLADMPVAITPTGELGRLFNALQEVLTARPDLGPETLREALYAQGFEKTLDQLQQGNIYTATCYGRDKMDTLRARKTFQGVWRMLARRQIEIDLHTAEAELVQSVDDTALSRILALRQQMDVLSATDDD